MVSLRQQATHTSSSIIALSRDGVITCLYFISPLLRNTCTVISPLLYLACVYGTWNPSLLICATFSISTVTSHGALLSWVTKRSLPLILKKPVLSPLISLFFASLSLHRSIRRERQRGHKETLPSYHHIHTHHGRSRSRSYHRCPRAGVEWSSS